jgi:hypothetical protein
MENVLVPLNKKLLTGPYSFLSFLQKEIFLTFNIGDFDMMATVVVYKNFDEGKKDNFKKLGAMHVPFMLNYVGSKTIIFSLLYFNISHVLSDIGGYHTTLFAMITILLGRVFLQ